ncbi:MAG: hypothetical protein ABI856_16545 [Nitrospira sp.]
MSGKKKHQRRKATSIDEAFGNSVDQGLLRSAAAMSQQLVEQVLKADPKIRSLLEQLVKTRLESVLRKLADKKNGDDM